MSLMIPILWVVGFLFALPFAFADGVARTFVRAFFVMVLGVFVPLGIFFLSVFLGPDSKSDCRDGWINCWIVAKLALTPLVIWATVALFVYENRIFPKTKKWMAAGLLNGAITASVCFIYGLVFIERSPDGLSPFLAVPGYIAGWLGVRAFQAVEESKIGWLSSALALFGSIPFWVGSVIWSRRIYDSLPEVQVGCFVVTAASRGHEHMVGPFTEVQHRGQSRRANEQLATFWQFEALWLAHAPQSHAAFRRIYNFVGPRIAARITSPWLADVTWLALKPAEWTAAIIIKILCSRRRDEPLTFPQIQFETPHVISCVK